MQRLYRQWRIMRTPLYHLYLRQFCSHALERCKRKLVHPCAVEIDGLDGAEVPIRQGKRWAEGYISERCAVEGRATECCFVEFHSGKGQTVKTLPLQVGIGEVHAVKRAVFKCRRL